MAFTASLNLQKELYTKGKGPVCPTVVETKSGEEGRRALSFENTSPTFVQKTGHTNWKWLRGEA